MSWHYKCKTIAGIVSRIRISEQLIKEREQWLRNPWSEAGIPIMRESIQRELRNIDDMMRELKLLIIESNPINDESRKRLIVSEVGRYMDDGLTLEQACDKLDITPEIYNIWKPLYHNPAKKRQRTSSQSNHFVDFNKMVSDEPRKVYVSQLSQFIKEANEKTP